jgi:hypothetical protein
MPLFRGAASFAPYIRWPSGYTIKFILRAKLQFLSTHKKKLEIKCSAYFSRFPLPLQKNQIDLVIREKRNAIGKINATANLKLTINVT